MRRAVLWAAVALALVIAVGNLAGCGGSSEPPAAATTEQQATTAPTTTVGNEFADEEKFERDVSEYVVKFQREQNNVEVTVDETDCIKSGPTTAACIVLVSSTAEPEVRLSVDVTCERWVNGRGEECILKAERVD
jgi:hypothetical protein